MKMSSSFKRPPTDAKRNEGHSIRTIVGTAAARADDNLRKFADVAISIRDGTAHWTMEEIAMTLREFFPHESAFAIAVAAHGASLEWTAEQIAAGVVWSQEVVDEMNMMSEVIVVVDRSFMVEAISRAKRIADIHLRIAVTARDAKRFGFCRTKILAAIYMVIPSASTSSMFVGMMAADLWPDVDRIVDAVRNIPSVEAAVARVTAAASAAESV